MNKMVITTKYYEHVDNYVNKNKEQTILITKKKCGSSSFDVTNNPQFDFSSTHSSIFIQLIENIMFFNVKKSEIKDL